MQECCAYQRGADVVEDVCQLHELPSRAQLVNAFRDTQPHKATGLESVPSGLVHRFPVQMAAMCWDLFLKIYAWQQEPIQAKGGILAVIPKKNDQSRAAHFRGIMLLPTIYKRLHAVLREQVIQVIAPLKPAGQIGGFKNQQVQFGSMGLQCFSRIASAWVLFSLTLPTHSIGSFVNWYVVLPVQMMLRHSFNRLPVMDAPLPESKSGWNFLAFCRELVHLPDWSICCGMFTHRHVLSAHPGLTQTRRGTRPGSPLADVIFHVAMLDITIELNHWASEQREYQALLKAMDIDMEAIVWSDDLAIPWLTTHATDLPAAIERLLQQIHKVFQRRGFELNMQKGKTTAVVTFRGPGAPDMRRKYQLSTANRFELSFAF